MTQYVVTESWQQLFVTMFSKCIGVSLVATLLADAAKRHLQDSDILYTNYVTISHLVTLV